MGCTNSSIASNKHHSTSPCSSRKVVDEAKIPARFGSVDRVDRDVHDDKSSREINKKNANTGIDGRSCGKNAKSTGENNRTAPWSGENNPSCSYFEIQRRGKNWTECSNYPSKPYSGNKRIRSRRGYRNRWIPVEGEGRRERENIYYMASLCCGIT